MDSLTAPHLPDDQLPRLMELINDSDSVELKLTVPEEYGRSAASALGVDPLEAHIRQVFFFDTPELTLDTAGVVVRARRIQRGKDDSVVKLRPVVPHELPDDVRRSKGFKVEVDAMPGGFVCSGSFKGRAREGEVWEAVAGRARLSRLFSKEQREFFATHAPDGIELDDLSVLGPVMVLKLKYTPEGAARPLPATTRTSSAAASAKRTRSTPSSGSLSATRTGGSSYAAALAAPEARAWWPMPSRSVSIASSTKRRSRWFVPPTGSGSRSCPPTPRAWPSRSNAT